MKELLLGSIAARQVVHIINEQDVHIPEPLAELGHLPSLDGTEELRHKAVARDVVDAQSGVRSGGCLADRLEQVGLPQSDAAVDKDRVVRPPWLLGHRHRSGMGQPVARPNDEVVKRVIGADQHLFLRGPTSDTSRVPGRTVGGAGRTPLLQLLLLPYEADREEPPGDGLGRFRELTLAPLLEVFQLDWLAHQQLQRPTRQRHRDDVIEPPAAHCRVGPS